MLSARMRRNRCWLITLYVEYFLFMCVKLKNMLKQGWERSQFSPLGLEAVYLRGWGGQRLFEKTMHIIKMRERESKHLLKSICLIQYRRMLNISVCTVLINKMIDMSNTITIDHTQRMTAFKEISKLQQNKCKNGHIYFKCRNVTRNIIFYLMCHFEIPKCTEIYYIFGVLQIE